MDNRQPVIITDATLVPDEFCEVTVTLSQRDWKWLQQLAIDDCPEHEDEPITTRVGPRTPRLELIRAALEKPCIECGGTNPPEQCRACGGTGLAGVPGAYLEARGVHVECR